MYGMDDLLTALPICSAWMLRAVCHRLCRPWPWQDPFSLASLTTTAGDTYAALPGGRAPCHASMVRGYGLMLSFGTLQDMLVGRVGWQCCLPVLPGYFCPGCWFCDGVRVR